MIKALNNINIENLEKKVLEESIDKLWLDLRTRKCLLRNNIKTVKDLLYCDKKKFMSIHNIGKKSFRVAINALKVYLFEFLCEGK